MYSGKIVATTILSSTTVFNIVDYSKCFLSSKSTYYTDFCETRERCWKFIFASQLHIKMISNRTLFF